MSINTTWIERPVFIASYPSADGRQFLPVSQGELERRSWFYRRLLDTLKLPPRQSVLIISDYNDHALTVPLQAVLHADGHVPCYAESNSFDARRTENFLRRLDMALVFGVNSAVLDGLEAQGFKPADLFANRVVYVRDESAYARLQNELHITLRRWREIGPALAMECRHGGGLHVDPNEWIIDFIDDEVLLTSRRPMLLEFERVRTGFRASVVAEICACGRDGIRLLPLA